MSVSKVPMGPLKVVNRDGVLVKFVPRGQVTEVGDASDWYTRFYQRNPFTESSGPTFGARIVVGFNVGLKKKWNMKHLTNLVFKIRKQQVEDAINDGDAKPHPQGGDIGITFLHQSGLWQPVHDKKPHVEDGAQVIFENTIKEKKSRFKADMIALAEDLVEQLEQDAVLLQFSENGVASELLTVFLEE